jgi:transaldolase
VILDGSSIPVDERRPQILYRFASEVWLDADLVTVPAKVLTLWAEKNFPMPDADLQYHYSTKSSPYEELDLAQPWEKFNIVHELTTKGLEKFAADYRKTLAESAGRME